MKTHELVGMLMVVCYRSPYYYSCMAHCPSCWEGMPDPHFSLKIPEPYSSAVDSGTSHSTVGSPSASLSVSVSIQDQHAVHLTFGSSVLSI